MANTNVKATLAKLFTVTLAAGAIALVAPQAAQAQVSFGVHIGGPVGYRPAPLPYRGYPGPRYGYSYGGGYGYAPGYYGHPYYGGGYGYRHEWDHRGYGYRGR